MKCDSCNEKIQETFLEKMAGTYVKDEKGKKHPICHECQRAFSKEQLLTRF